MSITREISEKERKYLLNLLYNQSTVLAYKEIDTKNNKNSEEYSRIKNNIDLNNRCIELLLTEAERKKYQK